MSNQGIQRYVAKFKGTVKYGLFDSQLYILNLYLINTKGGRSPFSKFEN